MVMPKVIISKMAYRQLISHMRATGFQYETGGVLLGYRFLWIFYIVGLTFPRYFTRATRMSFILNGEEHAEDAEKIVGRFIPRLKLIGIWHSHITEDKSFSMQDRKTNELFTGQIGRMLSVIVTQCRESNGIRLIPYYISGNSGECLCKYTIQGDRKYGKTGRMFL